MVVAKRQWDPILKAKLATKDVPALSINVLGADFRSLLGIMLSSEASIVVKAKGDNPDPKITDIINSMLFDVFGSEAFSNEAILNDAEAFQTGYGVSEIRIDNDAFEPDDHLVIKTRNSLDVMIDKNARRIDQSDWSYVINNTWLDKDEIKSLYGVKNDDAFYRDERSGIMSAIATMVGSLTSRSRSEYVDTDEFYYEGKYRIIELWHAKYDKVKLYRSLIDDTYSEYKPEDGMFYEEIVRRRRNICLTTVCPAADLVLENKVTPYRYFPFAINVPLNFNGGIFNSPSWVEEMTSLQEERNRLRSAAVDAVSKSANNAWVLPLGEGALQEDMQNRMSQYGAVFVRSGTSPNALQSLSPQMPSNIQALINANDSDSATVSGISPAAKGFSGGAGSEDQYSAMVNQTDASLRYFTKQKSAYLGMLGLIAIDFFRVHYDEKIIKKIVGSMNSQQSQQMQEQSRGQPPQNAIMGQPDMMGQPSPVPMPIDAEGGERLFYDDMDIQEMLSRLRRPGGLQHEVKVTIEPYVDTKRESELRHLTEIIKSSPPEMQGESIPDFIRLTSLPNREKMAAKYDRLLAARNAMPQNMTPTK
jgi:hypothetical protein